MTSPMLFQIHMKLKTGGQSGDIDKFVNVYKRTIYAGSCEFTLFCVFRRGDSIKNVSLYQGVIVDEMLILKLKMKFGFHKMKKRNVNLAKKTFVMPDHIRRTYACCNEKCKREVKNESWHKNF